MTSKASVLLIDDGELEDVRALLDELRVSYIRLKGEDISEGIEEPDLLLVTTFGLALALPESGQPVSREGRAVRIAIGSKDAIYEQSALRQAGLDFLVYRPIGLTLLRLLLLCALYRGEERRQTTRRPIGSAASFGLETRRAGSQGRDTIFFQQHDGTLAEVSAQGCRLLGTPATAEPGRRLWVELPGRVTGGDPLRVYGRVVRVDWKPREDTGEREASIGVRFEKLGVRTLMQMRRVLTEEPAPALEEPEGSGPPEPQTGSPREPESAPARAATAQDRRTTTRVAYEGDLVAIHDGVNVLVGRDLSADGMRVERHPMLAVGDRLRLSICVRDDGPLFVNASVVRDDSQNGLALRFEEIEPEVRRQIEGLLQSLPAIESVGCPRDGSILLTEIIPGADRPTDSEVS